MDLFESGFRVVDATEDQGPDHDVIGVRGDLLHVLAVRDDGLDDGDVGVELLDLVDMLLQVVVDLHRRELRVRGIELEVAPEARTDLQDAQLLLLAHLFVQGLRLRQILEQRFLHLADRPLTPDVDDREDKGVPALAHCLRSLRQLEHRIQDGVQTDRQRGRCLQDAALQLALHADGARDVSLCVDDGRRRLGRWFLVE